METLCTQRSVRLTTFVCLQAGMLWLALARAGIVQAAGVVTDSDLAPRLYLPLLVR